MTDVTGTMAAPGGGKPDGALVIVTLVDLSGVPVIGFAGDDELVGQTVVTPDGQGDWSVALTPTEDISSPRGDTLYRVDELARPGRPGRYYISVPDSGTHWVGDLRVSLPGSAVEILTGYLPLTGGTLTGALTLPGAPTQDLHAATKAYVDSTSGGGGGGTPSDTVEAETSYGQAADAGEATEYARGDHTHGTPALPAPGDIGAADANHTHNGVYDPAGTASATLTAHEQAADPHPDYLTPTEADAAYAALSHTHSGTVQASIVDAKGDLIAATADDTVARLAAGSDGQALVVRSSAAAGLAYVSPTAFQVAPLAHYGLLAASGDPLAFLANSAVTNGQVFLVRTWIPAGTTITNLWIAVRGGGTHDTETDPNMLGLYDDTGTQIDTTADDNTLFASAGWRGGALAGGPIAAQPTGRWVYIGHIGRGWSAATIAFPNGVDDNQAAWFARGPGGGNRRAMYQTGQTALPSSFDPTDHGNPTTFMPLYGVT